MNIRTYCVVALLLSVAICTFAQDAVVTHQDTFDSYKFNMPVPAVESVPCDFISSAALLVTTGSVVSIGSVPATARRAMINAPMEVYYGFGTGLATNSPRIATNTPKVFTGVYTDIDDLYFKATEADNKIMIYYFIK